MSKKIEEAKKLLESENYSCVAISKSRIYASDKKGIAPLMQWLESDPSCLRGACVADRVIGKAAAMLMLYGEVSEVYTGIISESALTALTLAGIEPEYGRIVPYIINRSGDGMCPMEQTCLDVNSPEEAYRLLKDKLSEMRKGNTENRK